MESAGSVIGSIYNFIQSLHVHYLKWEMISKLLKFCARTSNTLLGIYLFLPGICPS
jgi:hypothetical protein